MNNCSDCSNMLKLYDMKFFLKNQYQNIKMKSQFIFCFYYLLFAPIRSESNCLPETCRFEDITEMSYYENFEKGFWKIFSLICEFDLNNNAFKFNNNLMIIKFDEPINKKNGDDLTIFSDGRRRYYLF